MVNKERVEEWGRGPEQMEGEEPEDEGEDLFVLPCLMKPGKHYYVVRQDPKDLTKLAGGAGTSSPSKTIRDEDTSVYQNQFSP